MISFLIIDIGQVVEVFKEDEGLFIMHSQYHGCWWPGARASGAMVLTQLSQNIIVSTPEVLTCFSVW